MTCLHFASVLGNTREKWAAMCVKKPNMSYFSTVNHNLSFLLNLSILVSIQSSKSPLQVWSWRSVGLVHSSNPAEWCCLELNPVRATHGGLVPDTPKMPACRYTMRWEPQQPTVLWRANNTLVSYETDQKKKLFFPTQSRITIRHSWRKLLKRHRARKREREREKYRQTKRQEIE